MAAHQRACGDEQCLAGRHRQCPDDAGAASSRGTGPGATAFAWQRSGAASCPGDAVTMACQQMSRGVVQGRGCGRPTAARERWRRSLISMLVAALLLAAGVAGQSPKKLENNGGHFRFGNIRW